MNEILTIALVLQLFGKVVDYKGDPTDALFYQNDGEWQKIILIDQTDPDYVSEINHTLTVRDTWMYGHNYIMGEEINIIQNDKVVYWFSNGELTNYRMVMMVEFYDLDYVRESMTKWDGLAIQTCLGYGLKDGVKVLYFVKD